MSLALGQRVSRGVEPGEAVPSQTVENADLARRYRRIGRFTFGLPFVGTLAAFALLPLAVPSPLILAFGAALYVLSVLGLELGYHRHLSHGAFKAHPALRVLLLVFGAWGWSGPPVYWASTHRLHHGSSDRAGDPHSPHLFGTGKLNFLKGLWHAQVGWMLNTQAITNARVLARDILKDPLVVRVNDLYWVLAASGLTLPALVGYAVHPSLQGFAGGLLWAGFVRTFLVQLLYTGALNSVCHAFGRRQYRTADLSVNNAWLALPTLGQSWHNNHHAFPSAACLNFEWYQLDVSGLFVRLCRACRLASQLNLPTAAAIESKRLDTSAPGPLRVRRGDLIDYRSNDVK